MSIVSAAQFKAYARKADGDPTIEGLYQMLLDSSEVVVNDYLGYTPASASYVHTFYGNGKLYLMLRAPIIAIASITVAGVSKTVGDFLIDFETITEKNGNPFPTGSLVVVTYTGGWATIPSSVSEAILDIASLKALKMGEQIGVTSQTFDGGSTRSFLSYTNYAKFLQPLASIRIDRIERKTL